MKCLKAGHRYELDNHEPNPHPANISGALVTAAYELCGKIEMMPASELQTEMSVRAGDLLRELKAQANGNQTLQFIDKYASTALSSGPPKLITRTNGTTNEEVLRVLIDRLAYLNAQVMCRENSIALTHLETALLWLEKRTADRVKRGVENTGAK